MLPTRLALTGALLVFGAAACGADEAAPGADPLKKEKPFLDENTAAMNRMMADMDVKPTGSVDRDFVAMMVPHHQGAIDMAEAVLKYGKNETLRRLAQEIIVTQQQEIAAMRLAVGEPLPPSKPRPPLRLRIPGNPKGPPHRHLINQGKGNAYADALDLGTNRLRRVGASIRWMGRTGSGVGVRARHSGVASRPRLRG